MNIAGPLPLVSVVMTTFNGERFLEQQLDSLIQQTYPSLEIVIVDDASTDQTPVILKDYATRHPHIKFYANETNLGYIRNFEKGCSLAQGEYLSLCDQDDYWVPEKISKLMTAIGDATLVYSDSMLCNERLEPLGKKISDVAACQPFYSCLQQAVFCRIYGHALLMKRSLFELANPFPAVLPHDWWLSYFATMEDGINYLPEPLVYYRQHSANVFGAVGGKRRKASKAEQHLKKQQELSDIRTRITLFYQACPETFAEKRVLLSLMRSYQNFSVINNFRRMLIFLRYSHLLLAVKKRSPVRKLLFCLKMFVIIK